MKQGSLELVDNSDNSPRQDTACLWCWRNLDNLVCVPPLTFLPHKKSGILPFPHLHYLFQSFFSCAFYLFHCPFHSSSPIDDKLLLNLIPEPCYWLLLAVVSITFNSKICQTFGLINYFYLRLWKIG